MIQFNLQSGKSLQARRGFTMVEIMIVVAIIGIVLAIAHSTWLRQREHARSRSCQENLSKIDGAKEQYALDHNLGEGLEIPGATGTGDWGLLSGGTNGYIKNGPVCPASGSYTLNPIGTDPSCSYNSSGNLPQWAPPHDLPGGES